MAALFRYARLERTPAFCDSFVFAGADVLCLYVPLLRHAMAHLGEWAHSVAATIAALRSLGNVKAILVAEEMYDSGTARDRRGPALGIPTIGVQHGTFFPMHLIYTLPPGQVEALSPPTSSPPTARMARKF